MATIDDDLLLAAIDAGRENSYGSDEGTTLVTRRAQALEAYLGLNVNPAPEGRSQVVDRSVYETISTLLPSLVRIFVSSTEEVCKFTPVGPEDEEGANQQTAIINYAVTEQNQWEQVCSDWIFDALLLSNGYCLAYWDDSDINVREVYEGQSDDQLAALIGADVKVLQHTQAVDEQSTKEQQQAYQQAVQQHQMMMVQWQQAAQQAQAQGQQPPEQPPAPQPPQPVMSHDVVIERPLNEGKVCLEVIPPEQTFVHINTPNWTLKDCPYFEVRLRKTIAALRAMGLDVPEDISDEEDEDDSSESHARNRFGETYDDDNKGVMREVWARMIWVRADAGDGEERLYYVLAVGRTILHKEPCSRIPVSSMTPQPLPHRHIGMSVAETVIDLQNIKTAIKRGGLDNLYLANNGRHVISSKVNLADFLDARPGGVVRMLDDSLPAEGHIAPLVHPFAFDTIIGGLEYFDQERQNRTGAMRGAAGLEANAMNRAAVGTTMAMQSHAALRTEHVARMMAPAVETLYSIVQELVSKHRNKPLTLKLRGKWTTVDPQAWRTKRDVRISVGVGAGNKESMMLQLQNVLAAQMQVGLPMGLVGRENIRATNVEVLKLAGFANPDKFWPDPQSLPPQEPQPSPEQIKQQTEQQKMQFQAQQDQMRAQAEQQFAQQKMQLQAQVDQSREEMQARQKQLELQQQAELARLNAEYQAAADQRRLEFEQWKASLDAAVKLEIANKSAQTSMDTAEISRKPDDRVGELIKTIEQLRAEADLPAELVRDDAGRAVGVKKGGRVRKVIRGPDGRAIGVQ